MRAALSVLVGNACAIRQPIKTPASSGIPTIAANRQSTVPCRTYPSVPTCGDHHRLRLRRGERPEHRHPGDDQQRHRQHRAADPDQARHHGDARPDRPRDRQPDRPLAPLQPDEHRHDQREPAEHDPERFGGHPRVQQHAQRSPDYGGRGENSRYAPGLGFPQLSGMDECGTAEDAGGYVCDDCRACYLRRGERGEDEQPDRREHAARSDGGDADPGEQSGDDQRGDHLCHRQKSFSRRRSAARPPARRACPRSVRHRKPRRAHRFTPAGASCAFMPPRAARSHAA